MSICPWCQAPDQMPEAERSRPHWARWQCGSQQITENPQQSMPCQIRCLEAMVKRLEAEKSAKYMASWPDDEGL